MIETYKYEGREYRGSELPKLAKKVFGDTIYEELVRQIKEGVAEKKREVDYINLNDLEKKVYKLKGSKKPDGTEITTREIGRMLNLTPTGVTSVYHSAVKKLNRNVKGHISSLNVAPRTANALITLMNGNKTIEELATNINKLPLAFAKCDGLGYIGYCDTLYELEKLGYDMSGIPRFENKSQFSLYRARL